MPSGIFAKEYYGNGFTIVNEDNGLRDDLYQVVYKTISASHVKNGLLQLLDGTGYELADKINADPEIYRLYSQRFPQNKRQIGPVPLNVALQNIAGNSWRLVVDKVNKKVSFQIHEDYNCMISTTEVCRL